MVPPPPPLPQTEDVPAKPQPEQSEADQTVTITHGNGQDLPHDADEADEGNGLLPEVKVVEEYLYALSPFQTS